MGGAGTKTPKQNKSLGANKGKKADALYYVGIGASAGGLEALRPFVANLPPHSNMTFILAQHMSPEHRSLMVELLGRETKLKVEDVRHNMVPKPDTIYVAPPNTDVSVSEGKLRLSKPHNVIGPKPSVDRFFMSLADDREDKAIGIILSGTGSDGAHGIKAIRAAGGITIAQEPKSAKYDSMPKAAVRAGGADLVLTPQAIAIQLSSIVARPRARIAEEPEDAAPPSTIRGLIRQIAVRTGMDFSNYKDNTISRQVLRRMTAMQIATLEEYGEYLTKHHDELHELASNFLICVTSFFRDPEAFVALRRTLHRMLQNKKPGDDIRIWVPGCASGEEVYSIAILLAEEMGEHRDKYRIQIFATDINAEAVHMARTGIYTEAALAAVDGDIIKKYFSVREGQFHIENSLKEMVLFARQDLVQDPPFVRIDLISCRNLLIYFKPELQERVLKVFHYSLRRSGILFLGKSESISKQASLFAETDQKHRIYVRRDVSTPTIGGFPRNQAAASNRPVPEDKGAGPTPAALGQERLFSQYVPVSLLITGAGEILEFFGDCSPFLSFQKGRADFNLFNIIKPVFRAELRAFAHRVERSKESAFTNRIALQTEHGTKQVQMAVHYVGASNIPEKDLLIVSFELLGDALAGAGQTKETATNDERVSELEREVTLTRENLQTVIEELETANEELQSLNEEAQAANEELQASNEELETANEELQASNEELVTVNDELLTKSEELSNTNRDMENILNSLQKAVLVVDKTLSITRHNQMALDFFVIPPGQSANLIGMATTFEMPDMMDRISAVMKSSSLHECGLAKGERYYQMRLSPYFSGAQKAMEGVVMTISDITEKMISEEKLRLSASVFEAASEATLITDADNRILSVNPAFSQITGYQKEEVLGKNPSVLSSGKQSREFFKNMWETLLSTGTWRGEIYNRRKNGEIYPEWLTVNILRDERGRVIRHIGVFSDITDTKKTQALIEKQANFDTLTALPNRNLMMDRLHQLLSTSRRSQKLFAVLFIDLDNFKEINDSLGHHIGDDLLRKTALRLNESVRASDSVGRLGGDEFLVLLGELSSTEDIIPVVNKIITEVAQPMIIGGRELHTAASIGITVYPADGDTTEDLMRNADSAMYEAKKAGRGTFSFFTQSMQDAANRRHWIGNELNIAMRQDSQLAIYYQPIMDLSARRMVGGEALLRWNHPQRGFIPPAEFISVAEQNGMMGKLGSWVFERALHEAEAWMELEGFPLRISINLSPAQFTTSSDTNEVLRLVGSSPLAAKGTIVIEITESHRLAERKDYVQTLSRLKDMGCHIALDDFGTGFSSLSYIRNLPIDIIKIDRSFVRDCVLNPEDGAMVKAVLTMAESLHLAVVAEGIETPEQFEFLTRNGCQYGQGFLFGTPMPGKEYLAYFHSLSEPGTASPA